MNAGQLICYVILGKHDLLDLCEVLRLFILNPEDLRCSEAGEGNVCSILAELFLADHVVQVIALLVGSSVIPENCGTDHVVILVQDHKAVHLAAKADACHLGLVRILDELLDADLGLLPPILGLLLRPARMREIQGILL